MLADPLFVDPKKGDFRLKEDSPCRDKGVDVGLPFQGESTDLGAFSLTVTAFPKRIPCDHRRLRIGSPYSPGTRSAFASTPLACPQFRCDLPLFRLTR